MASSTIEAAVAWALDVASSPVHGYDQRIRWGPDYDCSSFVISAWEAAGVPVKQAGATYTGNMRAAFLRCGFQEVGTAVLRRGDVLLNEQHHTALYIGDGKIVQASINERGGITGGQTGDQTGGEIAVRGYYDFPWDVVLRWPGGDDDPPASHNHEVQDAAQGALEPVEGLPTLTEGSVSGAVLSAQLLLIHKCAISCGRYGADGEYGPATASAVRTFQRGHELEDDSVVGPLTWAALLR